MSLENPTAASAVELISDAGAESVTITFAAEGRSRYEPLIEAFETDNPDIHVQFVDLEDLMKPVQLADGGMIISPYLSMREIVSGADTAAAGVTAEAIEKGWLRDLTPLMDADPTFDRADFYPGTLEAGSRDGKLYLLPRMQNVTLLASHSPIRTPFSIRQRLALRRSTAPTAPGCSAHPARRLQPRHSPGRRLTITGSSARSIEACRAAI
jgi:hypothetical protein